MTAKRVSANNSRHSSVSIRRWLRAPRAHRRSSAGTWHLLLIVPVLPEARLGRRSPAGKDEAVQAAQSSQASYREKSAPMTLTFIRTVGARARLKRAGTCDICARGVKPGKVQRI